MGTHSGWNRAVTQGLSPSPILQHQGTALGVLLEMSNQQVAPWVGAVLVLEFSWVLGDPWVSCSSPPHHSVGLVPLPVHPAHPVLTPSLFLFEIFKQKTGGQDLRRFQGYP